MCGVVGGTLGRLDLRPVVVVVELVVEDEDGSWGRTSEGRSSWPRLEWPSSRDIEKQQPC